MMYNVKLTLDNKKVIDINAHISYEDMSIIYYRIFRHTRWSCNKRYYG